MLHMIATWCFVAHVLMYAPSSKRCALEFLVAWKAALTSWSVVSKVAWDSLINMNTCWASYSLPAMDTACASTIVGHWLSILRNPSTMPEQSCCAKTVQSILGCCCGCVSCAVGKSPSKDTRRFCTQWWKLSLFGNVTSMFYTSQLTIPWSAWLVARHQLRIKVQLSVETRLVLLSITVVIPV